MEHFIADAQRDCIAVVLSDLHPDQMARQIAKIFLTLASRMSASRPPLTLCRTCGAGTDPLQTRNQDV